MARFENVELPEIPKRPSAPLKGGSPKQVLLNGCRLVVDSLGVCPYGGEQSGQMPHSDGVTGVSAPSRRPIDDVAIIETVHCLSPRSFAVCVPQVACVHPARIIANRASEHLVRLWRSLPDPYDSSHVDHV